MGTYCVRRRTILILGIGALILILVFFSHVLLQQRMSTQSRAASTASRQPKEAMNLIANGRDAQENEFPYYVQLGISEAYQSQMTCGGTLIGNEYVLTVAHCVNGLYKNGGRLNVLVGVTHYYGKFMGQYLESMDIAPLDSDTIHIHELYDLAIATPLDVDNKIPLYNIALIRLQFPITNVPLISLPRVDVDRNSDGIIDTNDYLEKMNNLRNTTIIGTGKLVSTDVAHSKILKVATIPIFDFGGNTPSRTWYISIGYFGYYRQGTCNSDSGGPAILFVQDKPYLIGVLDRGGCENGTSSSTSTSYYMDWILNNTGIQPDTGTALKDFSTNPPLQNLGGICARSLAAETCNRFFLLCNWDAQQNVCTTK